MPFPIQEKLVVAIASSALFDLAASDEVYRTGDLDAYRRYQQQHEDQPLETGPAFPFIRRLLALNKHLPGDPVEVILLSRNDADSGLRVMNSIESRRLQISRAAFLDGEDPWHYMTPFNASLFLSGNAVDVRGALDNDLPAGQVLRTMFQDDEKSDELRIAFDFDGVIAGHEAESIYQEGGLDLFHQHEALHAETPISPGPLKVFFERIGRLQGVEREMKSRDPSYRPRVKTAIVTARNAPAHKRVVHTLRSWGLHVDQAFFLGGMEKARVLQQFRPHIFFDDQKVHVEGAAGLVPSVHIPFGELNRAADRIEGGAGLELPSGEATGESRQ